MWTLFYCSYCLCYCNIYRRIHIKASVLVLDDSVDCRKVDDTRFIFIGKFTSRNLSTDMKTYYFFFPFFFFFLFISFRTQNFVSWQQLLGMGRLISLIVLWEGCSGSYGAQRLVQYQLNASVVCDISPVLLLPQLMDLIFKRC